MPIRFSGPRNFYAWEVPPGKEVIITEDIDCVVVKSTLHPMRAMFAGIVGEEHTSNHWNYLGGYTCQQIMLFANLKASRR